MIRVVTAIITDARGRLLLVRKRGTACFMQPGGKIEPGETAHAALRRELAEEVGLTMPEEELHYVGTGAAPAANEPGMIVHAEIFRVSPPPGFRPVCGGEIEELRWFDAAMDSDLAVAPLTREQVLPRFMSA